MECSANTNATSRSMMSTCASTASITQPSLEEPRSVVQQLVTKFQSDCDIDSVNRINDAFLAIQEHRAQKLSTSRDLLHQWMRKVETAKWEAQRPADRPSARHSDEMSTLERERFALAKSINDLESSLTQYETVLATQKSTLAQLKQENSASGAKETASRMDLEWNLYKQLGIDWLGSEGGVVKCRVVDPARNDIHIVRLDPAEMSSVEQANQLWRLCEPLNSTL